MNFMLDKRGQRYAFVNYKTQENANYAMRDVKVNKLTLKKI